MQNPWSSLYHLYPMPERVTFRFFGNFNKSTEARRCICHRSEYQVFLQAKKKTMSLSWHLQVKTSPVPPWLECRLLVYQWKSSIFEYPPSNTSSTSSLTSRGWRLSSTRGSRRGHWHRKKILWRNMEPSSHISLSVSDFWQCSSFHRWRQWLWV